jgi:hypothetical protein
LAYELARIDELPVPVMRLRGRMTVRRTDLLKVLGVADINADAAA